MGCWRSWILFCCIHLVSWRSAIQGLLTGCITTWCRNSTTYNCGMWCVKREKSLKWASLPPGYSYQASARGKPGKSSSIPVTWATSCSHCYHQAGGSISGPKPAALGWFLLPGLQKRWAPRTIHIRHNPTHIHTAIRIICCISLF